MGLLLNIGSLGMWLERGASQGEGPETWKGSEPVGRSALIYPKGDREAAPRRLGPGTLEKQATGEASSQSGVGDKKSLCGMRCGSPCL